MLQGAYTPNGDFHKHFADLDYDIRYDLMWDLRLGLLAIGVDFEGITEPFIDFEASLPDGSAIPKIFTELAEKEGRVDVTIRIFEDGLTKDEFFERLSKLEKSLLFISWTNGSTPIERRTHSYPTRSYESTTIRSGSVHSRLDCSCHLRRPR